MAGFKPDFIGPAIGDGRQISLGGGGRADLGPVPAPFFITLPSGLIASGVVSWAVRLVNALGGERACGLLIHRATPGHEALEMRVDRRVRIFDAGGLPALEEANGDLSAYLEFYAEALAEMAASGDGPVVVSPNLLGDCYGIFAALSARVDLRIAGWCHLDSAYDRRVLAHYAPAISGFVGVSVAVGASLRAALPPGSAEVSHIPYGVEMGAERGARGPGAMRLMAVSRLEHGVKRAGALAWISRSLAERGVEHTLTVAGDGPALGDVRREAGGLSRVRVLGAVPPPQVRELLVEHDAFVLPSRAEGLSLAMLEAMASSCAPIVTRGVSGAADAITNGASGMLVDVGEESGPREVGEAFGRAIAGCSVERMTELGAAARGVIRERFSIDVHARRVSSLLDMIAASPRRVWPVGVNPAYTARPGVVGSGSVPADAGERILRLLDSLHGESVILHATGRHTRELEHVLRPRLGQIAAFTDDDPARRGAMLWNKPILAPEHAAGVGARHVVISSFIHQDEVYARRSVYERQGLIVHRLYE